MSLAAIMQEDVVALRPVPNVVLDSEIVYTVEGYYSRKRVVDRVANSV